MESDSMTFVLTHCDPWRQTGGDQIEKEKRVKVNCKFSGDYNVLFFQLQLIDSNISYCFVKELYTAIKARCVC